MPGPLRRHRPGVGGRAAGVGAAWVALVAYNAMDIGIDGLFGRRVGLFIGSKIVRSSMVAGPPPSDS